MKKKTAAWLLIMQFVPEFRRTFLLAVPQNVRGDGAWYTQNRLVANQARGTTSSSAARLWPQPC